jgi:hypothetical protein
LPVPFLELMGKIAYTTLVSVGDNPSVYCADPPDGKRHRQACDLGHNIANVKCLFGHLGTFSGFQESGLSDSCQPYQPCHLALQTPCSRGFTFGKLIARSAVAGDSANPSGLQPADGGGTNHLRAKGNGHESNNGILVCQDLML